MVKFDFWEEFSFVLILRIQDFTFKEYSFNLVHASLKTPHLSRQSYPFSFLCWEHAYNSKTTTVKRNDESHLKFDPKQKMVTEPWTVATRSRNRLRLNHEPNYFCKIYGWRRAKYITTSAFNAKRVFEKPWIFWFLKIECELWD